MLLYIALFIFITFLLYQYFTKTFDHWKKINVQGPKPLPFFGNLLEAALRRKQVGMIYKEIYDQFPDEKFVGIYRMTTPTLLIRDLNTVRQILIKDFDCFPERGIEFSTQKLGDNLFHCGSDTWAALRNRFTPAFTSGKLRNMFHTFDDYAGKLTDYVENVCVERKLEQNVYKLFMKYTISTAMSAFFGIDLDIYNDNSEVYSVIEKAIFTPSFVNELDLLVPGILKNNNISIFPDLVNKFCHEIAETVISHRNGSPSTRCDVMDVIITLKQSRQVKSTRREFEEKECYMKITDDVIAGQVFVFYAAGYGNNSLTLSYALYYLAKNKDVQDKLGCEIDETLEKFSGQLTYDSLNEMKYLDMVFYETLRIHPLTNSISRAVNQDYRISADLTINKGTTVLISPYGIHHDEKYYPEPEKFDPERFSAENVGQRHSCAFLSFGAGPRSCMGTRIAKIQFGVCVVRLLSKFRVESSGRTNTINKYNPWRTLLTPVDGVYLNFVPRNK